MNIAVIIAGGSGHRMGQEIRFCLHKYHDGITWGNASFSIQKGVDRTIKVLTEIK